MTMMNVLVVCVGLLFVLFAGAEFIGQCRWRRSTQRLVDGMAASPIANPQNLNREDAIRTLPPTVQAYFRAVLPDQVGLVHAVQLVQRGSFNLGETDDRWVDFSAKQKVVTNPPGFVWDANMRVMLSVPVHVHDAYVAQLGMLRPSLLGLYDMADIRGSGDIAEGELMRFLAEAPWYPTCLLPGHGVTWTAIDERSAKATLVDGPNSVSLTFVFGADRLIEKVCAEARGRTVGGKLVPTPWEGSWSDYAWRDNMLVPIAGEVAWLLPEGRKPYWRGRVEHIGFSFA
jgi:hypothetical protein